MLDYFAEEIYRYHHVEFQLKFSVLHITLYYFTPAPPPINFGITFDFIIFADFKWALLLIARFDEFIAHSPGRSSQMPPITPI